jgi:hypothetical protein
MLKKTIPGFVGFMLFSLLIDLSAPPANAQNAPKLRYGFQKSRSYGYDVNIVAQLPDEEVTHQGSLTYIVLSATNEQFVLKCMGHLGKSVKADPSSTPPGFGPGGFGGPPRIPGPPRFGGPRGFGPMSEPARPEGTTFTRFGGTVIFGNPTSLPLLLGDQTELIIEALPSEAKSNWDKQSDLGVIERSESDAFFRPFGPRSTSETSRGAKEQIDYAVIENKGDTVRISKKYSIKTAVEEGGLNHIDMSGSGEFVFDVKEGVIKSQTMKYDIKVNEKNTVVTIPVTLTYKLVSDTEMAERKKKAEEAAAAAAEANKPKPFKAGERATLIKDLRSGDENHVAEAAKRLAKAIPDDNTADISKALCQAFKKSNDWIKKDILDALEIWHAPDAEKTAIEAGRSDSFFVRAAGIVLLGKFKTKTAAEAAAAALPKNRGEASAALKAIGPLAEPVTIPYLKDRDFWVRKEACDILAEVGGKKGLLALKSEGAKASWSDKHFFDDAIKAVEQRLGSNSDDSAEPVEETPKNATEESKMHTWHDATGTYEVEAEFVKSEAGKVTIKKADGKTVTLPIKKLSKADQEYAEQQAKAQAEKPENPFE